MHVQTKYQNCGLNGSLAKTRKRQWLATVCTLMVFTQTPGWAQPATSASSPGSEASGPARFVLQADGTLVPVASPSAAPASSGQIPGATGGVRRLPDSTAEVAAPVVPPGASNAPSTSPNTTVQAGATIADPDSTPAARAVAAARNAMNAKQWTQLANFVPQARGDVLGIYPEYWSLRTQLGSTHMPGVQQALTDFITKNKTA